MTYAHATKVPIERSKFEIEQLLKVHGADQFASGWSATEAYIMFRLSPKDRPPVRVKMRLPLPGVEAYRTTVRRGWEVDRTDNQALEAQHQGHKARWRALLLVVKAKLEAVDLGISTIEREFMADIMLPGGGVVGDQLPAMMEMGSRLLLTAGASDEEEQA